VQQSTSGSVALPGPDVQRSTDTVSPLEREIAKHNRKNSATTWNPILGHRVRPAARCITHPLRLLPRDHLARQLGSGRMIVWPSRTFDTSHATDSCRVERRMLHALAVALIMYSGPAPWPKSILGQSICADQLRQGFERTILRDEFLKLFVG
jgi:hypothetical protein